MPDIRPQTGDVRREANTITVALIEDDESVRRSLARLLTSAGLCSHLFSSALDFLASPLKEAIDCVITDLRMPGLDGLQLQAALGQASPHLSIIFITGHGDVPASVEAMRKGALDFLEKPIDERALLGAVHAAAERTRKLKVSRDMLELIKQRYATLTPREREVLLMVTAGMLNKQIGFDLGTAEKTIKVHRARVMQKMKAQSLAELVRIAERLGLPVASN